MTAPQAWFVYGERGRYSDHEFWVVCSCPSEAEAEREVARLEALATAASQAFGGDSDPAWLDLPPEQWPQAILDFMVADPFATVWYGDLEEIPEWTLEALLAYRNALNGEPLSLRQWNIKDHTSGREDERIQYYVDSVDIRCE
jgi:hypothetical protein